MRFSQLALALGFLAVLGLVALGIWGTSLILGQESGNAETAQQGFTSFLPFGQPSPTETLDSSSIPATEGEMPRLRRVSDAPVAGASFFEQDGRTILRFVERETGHIYDASPESQSLVRRSNTTIPAVMDAFFLSATSTLLRVYETPDALSTVVGTLGTTTTPDAILATTPLNGYESIAVRNRAIVGVRRTNGGVEVDVLTGGQAPARTVARTPTISWIPHISGSVVYLTSAPSGSTRGSVYLASRSGLERIAGPYLGLQILPSDSGRTLLASQGSTNSVLLGTIATKDSFISLPFETLVEKCVWAARSEVLVICAVPKSLPAGLYPDDWKLGATSTSDEVWSVNLETSATELLADPELVGVGPIDAHKLIVDQKMNYLAFIHRTDMSLWILSLETPETGE